MGCIVRFKQNFCSCRHIIPSFSLYPSFFCLIHFTLLCWSVPGSLWDNISFARFSLIKSDSLFFSPDSKATTTTPAVLVWIEHTHHLVEGRKTNPISRGAKPINVDHPFRLCTYFRPRRARSINEPINQLI